MIRGRVSADKQAVISVEIHGPNGKIHTVDAVIDTGYDGMLTITPDIAATLQFPFREIRTYELGNGECVDFPIHDLTLIWDGEPRDVAAVVTDGGILAGVSLLIGYTLFIDVIDGGEVRIEARATIDFG